MNYGLLKENYGISRKLWIFDNDNQIKRVIKYIKPPANKKIRMMTHFFKYHDRLPCYFI